LSSSSSSVGFIAAASCLMLPTVLLPSVEALAALGAVGVAAAVTVGCVVSYFGGLVGLAAVACSLGKWLCLQKKRGWVVLVECSGGARETCDVYVLQSLRHWLH
jgi:hypothetical protein